MFSEKAGFKSRSILKKTKTDWLLAWKIIFLCPCLLNSKLESFENLCLRASTPYPFRAGVAAILKYFLLTAGQYIQVIMCLLSVAWEYNAHLPLCSSQNVSLKPFFHRNIKDWWIRVEVFCFSPRVVYLFIPLVLWRLSSPVTATGQATKAFHLPKNSWRTRKH